MNYNFKLNWVSECMPLMRTDRIKKAIEKGINAFMRNERATFIWGKLTDEQKDLQFKNNRAYRKILKEKEAVLITADLHNKRRFEKYKKGDYPLQYAVGDAICNIGDEIERRIVPYLIERGILKEDENMPTDFMIRDEEGEWCECEDEVMDDYMNSENYNKYCDYKEKVIEPYMNAERDKNYKYYCLWGGCFWWNTTFGLELAKMVMPNVNWKILQSNIHATITSDDEKLVFDILYFDKEDTETFGGKHAISEAKRYKDIK